MANSFSPLCIRRYQILAGFCSLITGILLICLDASSWRMMETNDTKLLAQFYSPLRHDRSRMAGNKTFRLAIGPLWRCLTTELNVKPLIIDRECTINHDSFDYVIISLGIGTLLLFTILSICIVNVRMIHPSRILRLLMSFILELASLWLIYGCFHIQKVSGPLNDRTSAGYFLGVISVLIICVLEWDDYFREIYQRKCSTTIELDRNQRLNAWISKPIHPGIDRF